MPDGRTATCEYGEGRGDAEVSAPLEEQTGSCSLVVGLTFDAESFRESGNAFMAARRKLGLSIGESEGTEPVGPGDLLLTDHAGNLIPAQAAHQAEYERRMREWHARRRRLGAES